MANHSRLKISPPRIPTRDTRAIPLPGKRPDPFYQSDEYLAWRKIVIERAPGGFCQDSTCKTPNRVPSRLFADHIIELRDDGAPTDPRNGRAVCGACHTRKTLAERGRRLAEPADRK